MTRPLRSSPALLAALALAGLALGVAGCGYESEHKEVVEGEPVELGELQYNVIFSRFLNPSDNEDAAYLVGQPEPAPGSTYFGVFVEVQNESEEPQTIADEFTIVNADHNEFEAVESESLYALPFGTKLEGEEQVPLLDSTPDQGPIEGSVVIFELPTAASDARPLTLEIPGPEGPAEVTLDL